jgi:CheY-like chemotaxis protein
LATMKMPLFVDPTRVEQVLVNLITNAAKYTPKGGHVTIRAFPQDDQVVICVKDSGIGIPPTMLPRVFELFTQVNPSIDRTQGGLGIGLTVVRRLVEMHEGTVSASSEGLGKGSEFTIRLPMGRVLQAGDATPPLPTSVSAGLRVLVVDDNVDTAQSVSLLLKTVACITETAYDGQSAIERAKSFRPDVIVLDIGLPGLDGYEVATRIRRDPAIKHAKLIAISGYGQEQDRTRAKQAGFDHHLVKPVQFDALCALVSKAT